jgi:AcrR family transcriptional regulator
VGYARMSMDSVATEAGVARATVYRRYRDKADLVTAAIADNAGGQVPTTPTDHPRDDLVTFLRAFDERFDERFVEVIATLVASRDQRAGLELHRGRVIEPRGRYMAGLLRRAQSLGQLDAELDVDLAVQMLAGSIFTRRLSGTPSRPGWAERAVDLVFDGSRPRP